MIGWINNSVESFICDTFGAGTWQTVLEKAGLGNGGWVSSCPYPDSDTYKLVITASDLLGVTPAQALEAYGVYFVDYVTKQGYDKLLQTLGSNIAEFLQSLNNLHLHLTLSFPSMVAPAFKCTSVGPESLELHYYSRRPALGPIVVGVLRGLAERYWDMGDRLGVKLLRGREDGSDDHEVFLVTYPYQAVLSDWDASSVTTTVKPQQHFFTLSPDTFHQMFPFHILMDQQCRVLQAGAALSRLFPSMRPGSSVGDHFQLCHPYTDFSYDKICNQLNNAFLLRAKSTALELKGQMVPVPVPLHPGSPCPATAEGLLFMGSVRLSGLDDMRDQRLFLSDIPLHDLNRDTVLLVEQRQAEAQLKERFEALTLDLKEANIRLSEATQWLDEERQRSDRLLYQMLPPHVATGLKHGERTPASEHQEATILFSDIVGFTEISAKCSPMEVCSMLDELYHQFDTAIEEYPELYKVETIGDAYMVVANVTSPCDNHADLVLEFAVRMHEVARGVTSSLGDHVRIRVGMHTGPVVAGVVGKKMPRFCLFGDTVNTASRMESHGLPGQIHISEACYGCIRNKEHFVIRERGNITVKGKGDMRTFLITPAEQACRLLGGVSRLSLQSLYQSDTDEPSFTYTTAATSGTSRRPNSLSLSRAEYLLPARMPSFTCVAGQSEGSLSTWLANSPDTADRSSDRTSDLASGRISSVTVSSAASGATASTTSGACGLGGSGSIVLGLPDSERGSISSAASFRLTAVPRRASRLSQRSVDAGAGNVAFVDCGLSSPGRGPSSPCAAALEGAPGEGEASSNIEGREGDTQSGARRRWLSRDGEAWLMTSGGYADSPFSRPPE